MRLFCLDLASTVGWACGTNRGEPISHGILKLPKTGEDIGRFIIAFRDWLGPSIEELAPTEIIFEQPILPTGKKGDGPGSNLTTCRKLYGLACQTEVTATDYKIPVREANLSDIRKPFVGVVRAPLSVPKNQRRKWIKGRIVAECQRRGFDVKTDDEGDALALLAFGLSLYQPGFELRQANNADGRTDAAGDRLLQGGSLGADSQEALPHLREDSLSDH